MLIPNSAKLFGYALREVRKNRNFSQETLASTSGLDRTYISMLERGIKNPTLHTVFKLSQSLDASPGFLIELMITEQKSYGRKKHVVEATLESPIFGTTISCGKLVGNTHLIEKLLSIEKLSVKNPSESYFVKVVGDSMSKTLHDGDFLIIDRTLQPKNGQIILAKINNEFVIKRFHCEHKVITLTSHNPLLKKIIIKNDPAYVMCGVVVSTVRLNL